MNKRLEFETKEKLLNSYYEKTKEINANPCIATLIDYLSVNGYLNVKKIRSDFDL